VKAAIAACLLASSAQAAVMGVVSTEQGSLELHDEAGATCKGEAKRADFVSPRGERTGGCWIVTDDGMIWVVFFDTDTARIPVRFVKKPEQT
jgi:hypothetical protein